MLSTVGLYLSIPYSQEESRRPADKISDLDPIEVAGRCRKDVVLRYAKELDLDFAIEAVSWTDNLDDMAKGPISNTHHFSPTSTQYRSHFSSLTNWGILARLTNIGPLRYIAKYFSIPKTPTCDRAIFNGRALSKMFKPPPPVNIPSVQEIILLLAMLLVPQKSLALYVADIRHWFHQIKVGHKLWQYFGVCMRDDSSSTTDFFAWKTLPMGFSFSPRICQCIAWTLLLYSSRPLHNFDGLRVARAELRHAKHPPRYVFMRNDEGVIVGIVSLTYDNILVASSNDEMWQVLVNQIEHNLERSARIVMKEKRRFSCSDLHAAFTRPGSAGLDTTEHGSAICRAAHLGVEYALNPSGSLRWRHDPSRLDRWLSIHSKLSQPESSWTPRDIARACGIVVWHLTIALEPLCDAVELIRILRRIAPNTALDEQPGWDQPCELLPNERTYLLAQITSSLANPWMRVNELAIEQEILLFVDASKRRMGAVVCDRSGEVIDVLMGKFPTGIDRANIYIKELVSAVLYTQLLIKKRHLRNCRIYLLIDNSAAFFALSNWYSSSELACEWLSRLHHHLRGCGCTLTPISIISEDNPADTPSRGSLEVCRFRLMRGMKVFKKHLEGIRHASKRVDFFEADEGDLLRHQEHTTGMPNYSDDLEEHFSSQLHSLSAPSAARAVDEDVRPTSKRRRTGEESR